MGHHINDEALITQLNLQLNNNYINIMSIYIPILALIAILTATYVIYNKAGEQ